jgi:hypothetical protein
MNECEKYEVELELYMYWWQSWIVLKIHAKAGLEQLFNFFLNP